MNRRIIAAGAILALAVGSGAALTSATAAASHPAPARAGAFKVTLTVNKTEPMVDSNIKLKGTVKPAAAGQTVQLQLRYAGHHNWKAVDTAILSHAGKYKFKERVTNVNQYQYRVMKAAGPNHRAGHSPMVTVTVYHWRDLTTLKPVIATAVSESDSVMINGTVYPHSVHAVLPLPSGQPAHIEYNLDRDAKAIRGLAGLDDASHVGSSATVTLSTDGKQMYTGSFQLTQSAPVSFSLEGVFRLSITMTSTGEGIGALGTPQVLCNF